MNKKYLSIFIVTVLLLGVILVLWLRNNHGISVEGKVCRSDSDCAALVAGSPELAIYPPCFRGRCQNPSTADEWIEYCDSAEENSRSLFVWNCYQEAAYAALRPNKNILQNAPTDWRKSFAICDKYIPQESSRCKLDVCSNLRMVDGGMRNEYPEIEECKNQVGKLCPNGRISDNLPCRCRYPAGSDSLFTVENYKQMANDKMSYCCDGVESKSCGKIKTAEELIKECKDQYGPVEFIDCKPGESNVGGVFETVIYPKNLFHEKQLLDKNFQIPNEVENASVAKYSYGRIMCKSKFEIKNEDKFKEVDQEEFCKFMADYNEKCSECLTELSTSAEFMPLR